jgi:hypothetical protein
MIDNKGIINLSTVSPVRVEDNVAKAYRLARRNGELVLQGCFQWTQGRDYGHEWRDVPTVELEAQ